MGVRQYLASLHRILAVVVGKFAEASGWGFTVARVVKQASGCGLGTDLNEPSRLGALEISCICRVPSGHPNFPWPIYNGVALV
jgi:hypothetical protein